MKIGQPPQGAFAWIAVLSLIIAAPAWAREPDPSRSRYEQLYAAVPYVAQIVNLALFDPVLAASLVPDTWIDSLTASTLAVEAEVAVQPSKSDPPLPWPIGPWNNPESLAASIAAVEPRAVASLYGALRPRFAESCRQRDTSPEKCERAIRTSVSRLSAKAVEARAIGGSIAPITPTQQKLARLGEPVVLAVRRQLRGVGRALWGDPTKAIR
jgi:hypothetical protein